MSERDMKYFDGLFGFMIGIIALGMIVTFMVISHVQTQELNERLERMENNTKIHQIVLAKLVNMTNQQTEFNKGVIIWAETIQKTVTELNETRSDK